MNENVEVLSIPRVVILRGQILRGDAGATEENEETFGPGAARPPRTIYWTGHYQTLQKLAVQLKKK